MRLHGAFGDAHIPDECSLTRCHDCSYAFPTQCHDRPKSENVDVKRRFEDSLLRIVVDYNMNGRGFSVQQLGVTIILDRTWQEATASSYEQQMVRSIRYARPDKMRDKWKFYPACETYVRTLEQLGKQYGLLVDLDINDNGKLFNAFCVQSGLRKGRHVRACISLREPD